MFCKDFVSVWEAWVIPAISNIRKGDSIADLIALAGGSLPGAELNAIQHSIYQADTKRYEFQSIDLTGNGSNIISAGDRIMVPYDTAYQSRKGVTLSGRFVTKVNNLFSDGDTYLGCYPKERRRAR